MSKANLVACALAEVGTREEGGNNKGPRVAEYQRASWMSADDVARGFAWCAAFCCWVLQRWLETEEGKRYLGKKYVAKLWRCYDASAFGWAKWARKHSLEVLPEGALAKAGDFVVFDFSHIGIVVSDQVPGSSTIETVEGNTNGKGERDSTSGDGVWRKSRPISVVKHFIRLGDSAP